MKSWDELLTVLRTAEDLVYPRRCPVCDKPVRPFGALICPECQAGLPKIRGHRTCRKCGRILPPYEYNYCGDCRRTRHRFERGCAVFPYRGVSGSIYRFKYEGRAEYAAFFGRCMAERIREEFPAVSSGNWILVPVPCSREKLRKRGYNQAALLAREAASALGLPEREDVLVRVRDTKPMRNMSASARVRNLENAFIAYTNDVKLLSIMLVDDIYTTGATVDACAAALYQAGAAAVCFAALSIGDSMHD